MLTAPWGIDKQVREMNRAGHPDRFPPEITVIRSRPHDPARYESALRDGEWDFVSATHTAWVPVTFAREIMWIAVPSNPVITVPCGRLMKRRPDEPGPRPCMRPRTPSEECCTHHASSDKTRGTSTISTDPTDLWARARRLLGADAVNYPAITLTTKKGARSTVTVDTETFTAVLEMIIRRSSAPVKASGKRS